jgi:hypothetical protein
LAKASAIALDRCRPSQPIGASFSFVLQCNRL